MLTKVEDRRRRQGSHQIQGPLGGTVAAGSLVAPGIGDSVELDPDMPIGWASLCRRSLAGLNFECHPHRIGDSVATRSAPLHANAADRA